MAKSQVNALASAKRDRQLQELAMRTSKANLTAFSRSCESGAASTPRAMSGSAFWCPWLYPS